MREDLWVRHFNRHVRRNGTGPEATPGVTKVQQNGSNGSNGSNSLNHSSPSSVQQQSNDTSSSGSVMKDSPQFVPDPSNRHINTLPEPIIPSQPKAQPHQPHQNHERPSSLPSYHDLFKDQPPTGNNVRISSTSFSTSLYPGVQLAHNPNDSGIPSPATASLLSSLDTPVSQSQHILSISSISKTTRNNVSNNQTASNSFGFLSPDILQQQSQILPNAAPPQNSIKPELDVPQRQEQQQPPQTTRPPQNGISDHLDFGLLDPLYAMSPSTLFLDSSNGLDSNVAGPSTDPNVDPSAADGSIITDSNDLISWLFSDAMIQNARDPVLSPAPASWDSPMALQNVLTSPAASTHIEILTLSESKRQKLLQLIPEVDAKSSDQNKFSANTTVESLQRYIAHFWLFFHPQYPILHRPTFVADRCPEGLLWVIILIGAVFDREDEFGLMVAEPLRWILFGSPDFDPPAKLWVIQALLLLEMFEKTMTNRKMHIRGHIHHGSTLQLIKRGPLLQGSSMSSKSVSSAAEAALNAVFGDNLVCEGMEGGASGMMLYSRNNDDNHDGYGKLDPWKRWIQFEETKRAALFAFILDVNHATMFGHVSLIGVHELRVSLPCREDLWDSNNPDEVIGYSNGTPGGDSGVQGSSGIQFIEALKLILNKKPVQTETFGRKVLLSGLLSIQYNMQQRDLQVTSIGWGAFRNTWRDVMRASYMFWRNDAKLQLQTVEQKRAEINKKRKEEMRKNEHSTNGDNRKRFSNSSIEFEGKCALCELEEREISDCDSSDDESIVRISLRNKSTIDIISGVQNSQNNEDELYEDSEMYTCRHGNTCIRRKKKGRRPSLRGSNNYSMTNSAGIPDFVSYPPKFILEIAGCSDPFLHFAMIDMSIAQYDLQFYCGIISVFNSSVKRSDYMAARQRVVNWVKSPQGTESLHFAVHFLKEMYLCGEGSCHKEKAKDDVCPNPFLKPKRRKKRGENADLIKDEGENCNSYYGSKRARMNDGSHRTVPTSTQTGPAYPNNPYISVYDPIAHRPYIVFICVMLIWAYGDVIGGAEDPELWTPSPPLPSFLFDREAHRSCVQSFMSSSNGRNEETGSKNGRTDGNSTDGCCTVDEYGNVNGYPMTGGYNESQQITPAILGRHVFMHMKAKPHKVDGLKYLEWLSKETMRAMVSKTCVGITGAGSSNVPREDNESDVYESSNTTGRRHSQSNNVPSSFNSSRSESVVLPDSTLPVHSTSRFYNSSSTAQNDNSKPPFFNDNTSKTTTANSSSQASLSSISSCPQIQINHTAGLLKLAIESLHNHRWELINEGERLLTNCLERSMGRKETKCHYLRWEC